MRRVVGRILVRVGIGLGTLGLVACCGYPFGIVIRGMGNIDDTNPMVGIGIRVGFLVIGFVLAVVGMFIEPSGEAEAEESAAARTASTHADSMDPRVSQFLNELSQQARITLQPSGDPSVYSVSRILWVDARGSHFRGFTTVVHQASDADVTSVLVCMERPQDPAAHVIARKDLQTGQVTTQVVDDMNVWMGMVHAGEL